MAESYSIVYMYHIFFTHSSANGHSGCFHVLAIVNSAAMKIGVWVSFWITALNYIPRSEIDGSYGNSILVFWGATILFAIVAAPTYQLPPTG